VNFLEKYRNTATISLENTAIPQGIMPPATVTPQYRKGLTAKLTIEMNKC
jgi:hypothetical protein